MRKITTKILILILFVNILISNIPSIVAFGLSIETASGVCGDNAKWSLDSNGILVITGEGEIYNYDRYSYYNISPLYQYKDYINTIKIEEGITKIGKDTFNGLENIEKVLLPNSLKYIGDGSFRFCGMLLEITLPVNLVEIGISAFESCSSLVNLVIPSRVIKIDNTAFNQCTNLANIILPEGLLSIGEGAFSNCVNLVDIDLPDSLTQLGYYSFESCRKLESIKIPNEIKVIKSSTFQNCENLTQITFPSKLEVIESNAFWYCVKLADIELPEGLKSIETGGFIGCSSLVNVTVPESVENLGDGVFAGCTNLEEVKLPSQLLSISNSLFMRCTSLRNIDIPSGVTNIYNYAFYDCMNLEKIDLPYSLKNIGSYSFYNCKSIKDISLPENTLSIGNKAFESCLSLTTMLLPESISMIEDNSLYGNTNYKVINNSYAYNYVLNKGFRHEIILGEEVKYDNIEYFTFHDNVKYINLYEVIEIDKILMRSSDISLDNVKLESTNESIAMISEGKIAGVGYGNCNIIAKYNDIETTLKIIINEGNIYINATGVNFISNSLTINKGQNLYVPVEINPYNATERSIIWKSTDNSIVKVENGLISAIAPGTAIITASIDGYSDSIFIEVKAPLLAIFVDNDSIVLNKNESRIINFYHFPFDTTDNREMVLSSSDESIAIINNLGLITGVSPGETTIKLTNGSITKDVSVKVVSKLENISLNKLMINGSKNMKEQLIVNYDPSDTTDDKTVIWTSSSPSIASVNDNGLVSLVSKGIATITAKVGTLATTCNVIVTEIPLKSISLNFSSINLLYGEREDLNVIYDPVNTTDDKSIVWTTSDNTVATVDFEGNVVGMSSGTAIITATTLDGMKNATCVVTVEVPVIGVELDKNELYFTEFNQMNKLVAKVLPLHAPNQELIWASSNESVATVSDDGIVKAIGNGTAMITVTSVDGQKSTACKVTVAVPVSGITLDKNELFFSEFKQTSMVVATIMPVNAANNNLIWSSSDETVATVNDYGTVTALGNGTAKITVLTEDGNFTASCIVTVSVPVLGVSLDQSSLYFTDIPQSRSLTATILPANAANKNLTWVSSDETVATVSSAGTVTSVGNGWTLITVTTEEGAMSSSCYVVVSVPVASVELDNYSLHFTEPFQTSQLIAKISPINAANQNVIWSSNDEKIATVDATGKVTAIGNGTTEIRAMTEEGRKIASCNVTVAIKLKGITLDQSEIVFTDFYQFKRIFARLDPSNALNQKIIWSSSNESVATVSYDGAVTAQGNGSAVITATTEESQFTASCIVTVAVPVSGVVIDKTELLFTELNQSHQLYARVFPANAVNQKVTWASNNESVAKVSDDGIVTAVANGTALITVTTEEGQCIATCAVLVALPVSGIELDKSELLLTERNQTSTLKASIYPSNAANQNVIWSSSDDSVATVNQFGTVTAAYNGTAIITVTSEDGNFSASTVVTVAMSVTAVTLDKKELYFWELNKSEFLIATILPYDAVNQKINWTSSDDTVAIVSADGKVTAMGNGTATVKITSEDGQKSAECIVIVAVPVSSVSLNKKEIHFTEIDQTDKLEATIMPLNAANQKLNWTSTNETVARISSDGIVTAVGNGTSIIIVSSVDGDIRAYCTVSVAVPVTGVTLNKSTLYFTEFSQTTKLNATVMPLNAANQNLTWVSSDDAIAKVNFDGTVTAMGNGTAIITASTLDGYFTAFCEVTVAVPVTGVTLDQRELNFTEFSQTCKLVPTIMPLHAANQNLIWTSDDESVATIDTDGIVTAIGNGTTMITVTTVDGHKTAICSVTVKVPVSGISLSLNEMYLTKINQSMNLVATITPANAANHSLLWTSSDESVATVNAEGIVTAIENGTARITVATEDGDKSATCLVTVKVAVTSVILDRSELYFTLPTQKAKLVATVTPLNAVNQNLIWTSSNTTVAIVAEDGVVTAIDNGVATITVTTEEGLFTATCEVKVAVPVSGIKIDSNDLSFTKFGQKEKLVATIYPWNAVNQKVLWSSADETVASVSNEGLVTAVGNGSTKITVTTEDGSFIDIVKVTVQDFSGIYTIKSKNSGLVMDVYDGGMTEGTNIIQYSYHGMENQQWSFESLGNGYYKITSVLNPDYSIDVYGGGDTMGNRVIQYHYHGGTNQQWKILKNADGSVSLMSRLAEENGTNFVLDVFGGGKTEGVNVIQWAPNGGDNQKWFLQPVASHTVNFNSNGGSEVVSVMETERSLIVEPAAPEKESMVFDGWYKDEAFTLRWNFASDRVPTTDITLYAKWVKDYSGTYIIRSKNSNLVMDVYGGGTTEGTNIIQYSYHGMTNQQWKFESLNNGYYKITSVLNPEYSIDVYGGGTTMGNRVIQYHYHGGINQQWKILENPDGSISLMSRLAEESGTGYLLDVFGGGKTEGVNVIQWISNNGDNQKWYLENVN